MQPDLDHDTLQPWTPRCALDGPKWNDHDLFQAILLRGQKVLLTTYSQNRGEYLDPIDELQTPVGTMWDYTSKYRRQQWIATSQREHPALVMENIQGMHTMKWMGKNCRVADPDKIHFPRVSALCHKSFIHTPKPEPHMHCPTHLGVVGPEDVGRCMVHHRHHNQDEHRQTRGHR